MHKHIVSSPLGRLLLIPKGKNLGQSPAFISVPEEGFLRRHFILRERCSLLLRSSSSHTRTHLLFCLTCSISDLMIRNTYSSVL